MGYMDVYDFDKTLYPGDATIDFLVYCMRRHPAMALGLPRAAVAAVACFGLHVISKTRFKAELYRMLTRIPDIDSEVARFWRAHERRMAGPCRPRPGDLVVSGSPEFLLRDVCARRGLLLLASQVDPHTGRVLGPNCSESEKVTRVRAAYPDARIGAFYSDSHKDDPLANLAERAFLVRGKSIRPWS